MNTVLKHALALAGLALATQAFAQVTFYENEAFDGRSFTTQRRLADFERGGFNDRASSAVVRSERFEVCSDADFRGRCVVLRPGQYPSLAAMGLNDRISSVRPVDRRARFDDERYAPPPIVDRDYRQRPRERLYEARVISVHAVLGMPDRRCWIERHEVNPERGGANVPGALLGAVIGGILGHQVGGGSGRDAATVGGTVAGAVVGANVNRDRRGQPPYGENVERCSGGPRDAHPEYWDVTYEFRGQQHRVQMTAPPGDTVTVNRDGEPRARG